MFEDDPDFHPFTGHSTLFVPSYTLLYGKTHLLEVSFELLKSNS